VIVFHPVCWHRTLHAQYSLKKHRRPAVKYACIYLRVLCEWWLFSFRVHDAGYDLRFLNNFFPNKILLLLYSWVIIRATARSILHAYFFDFFSTFFSTRKKISRNYIHKRIYIAVVVNSSIVVTVSVLIKTEIRPKSKKIVIILYIALV
jgi:hypothetical protein